MVLVWSSIRLNLKSPAKVLHLFQPCNSVSTKSWTLTFVYTIPTLLYRNEKAKSVNTSTNGDFRVSGFRFQNGFSKWIFGV